MKDLVPASASSYREARRNIEVLVRDAVVAALSAEGRSVTDIRKPDSLERRRPAADWDFLLDEDRVGLEVTEFKLPTQEEQAGAGSDRVASLMVDRLAPLAAELQLGFMTLDLRYLVGKVPTKARTPAEAERLMLAIEAGMRRMSTERLDSLDIGTPVPWVQPTVKLRVVDRSSDHPRVMVVHGSGDEAVFVQPVVDQFIADRAKGKAIQTAAYERGILGIYGGWIAGADNLVEAIEKLSDVPWWRVYYLDRTGAAVLVYPAGELRRR